MSRTVQDIFNFAIDNRYYQWNNRRTSYMCEVLKKMRENKEISYFERFKSKFAIQCYLYDMSIDADEEYLIMWSCLRHHGYPATEMETFYRNWDNRPKHKCPIYRMPVKYALALLMSL